jgi:hypothetical protein
VLAPNGIWPGTLGPTSFGGMRGGGLQTSQVIPHIHVT